ncbi:MAG: lytic murein transglycosylase B, partial [Lautropia mirabilis]
PTYRARFLQPVRIDGGLKFWEQHAGALERATQEHGVPAEIIVAIIGVETLYGRNTGKFPTIQALSTLAFDFPPRAAYFRKELEQFLLYCRENGLDPMAPRGSYAGAIGTPQFMPGSIRSYATDFDGDGRIDLVNSPVDAIGSVARFLAIHGWQKDRDLYYPATLAENADPASLLARGPKPELSIADLRAAGISSPLSLPADQPLMLVDLPNGANPPSYVIGTGNFYAITRYNRSFFYAMAVTELAEVLHQRHAGTLGAPQLELPNQPTLPQKPPSP